MYIYMELDKIHAHTDYIEEEVRTVHQVMDYLQIMKSACEDLTLMLEIDAVCDKLERVVNSMKRREELMGEIVAVMHDVQAEIDQKNEEINSELKIVEP